MPVKFAKEALVFCHLYEIHRIASFHNQTINCNQLPKPKLPQSKFNHEYNNHAYITICIIVCLDKTDIICYLYLYVFASFFQKQPIKLYSRIQLLCNKNVS